MNYTLQRKNKRIITMTLEVTSWSIKEVGFDSRKHRENLSSPQCPQEQSSWGVKQTTYLHLLPSLRICGICTSAPPCNFLNPCLIMHRSNFHSYLCMPILHWFCCFNDFIGFTFIDFKFLFNRLIFYMNWLFSSYFGIDNGCMPQVALLLQQFFISDIT
jgi:hypothetical protein